MVPGAGIEPARYSYRGILSPLRLPISPPGHFAVRIVPALAVQGRAKLYFFTPGSEYAFPQCAGNQIDCAFCADVALIQEWVQFNHLHGGHVTCVGTILQE